MSPQCQPFTNEMGLDDNKSNAFNHLVIIFKQTKYPPTYFLLENVKNFENSMTSELIKSLLNATNYADKVNFLLFCLIFPITD